MPPTGTKCALIVNSRVVSRVLVTGGAGFIGSHLVRRLARQEVDVLNLDKLTYAANQDSLTDIVGWPNYHFERLDICDAEALKSAIDRFRPRAIVHLAAESHVDRSINQPQKFLETNVQGTFNLLQASLRYWHSLEQDEQSTFRFVHVSTDEVFGDIGDGNPTVEKSRYNPSSPYSASKAAADHMVKAWYRTYGLPTIITHSSNNYGPCQHPEKLLPLVIVKCLSKEAIPVYGSGSNTRSWLFVDDHCRGLLRVLECGQVGAAYNIGGIDELANVEMIQRLCRVMDSLVEKSNSSSFEELVTYVDDRPGHDQRYSLDNSRISKELGWEPQVSIEDGLRETAKWYIDNPSWWQAHGNEKGAWR